MAQTVTAQKTEIDDNGRKCVAVLRVLRVMPLGLGLGATFLGSGDAQHQRTGDMPCAQHLSF